MTVRNGMVRRWSSTALWMIIIIIAPKIMWTRARLLTLVMALEKMIMQTSLGYSQEFKLSICFPCLSLDYTFLSGLTWIPCALLGFIFLSLSTQKHIVHKVEKSEQKNDTFKYFHRYFLLRDSWHTVNHCDQSIHISHVPFSHTLFLNL